MPFQAAPGVVKYRPINLDDHKPHFQRCKLTQATREERALRRKKPALAPQRPLL